MNKFSERLRELRLEKDLSQLKLGKELGYTQAAIGKWEAGTRSPNIDSLIEIARFFRVSVDYLLGLED